MMVNHRKRRTLISAILLLGLTAFLAAEPISLAFTGDIMFHNTQLRRSWLGLDDEGNDRGYDFSPSFEWISDYLKSHDLVVGNLETTLGGAGSALVVNEKYAFREYQAYPTFVTPDELAPALLDAGFNLLGTANNHCMDSNIEGAARTVKLLEEAGLDATGTSGAGSPEPWRGRIGDFQLSVLSWTASTNGLISPRGMETINAFNAHGTDDRLAEMLKEIRTEAELEPDLLILAIHWGQEYFEEPDQYQLNLAELAIKAGVDIIIGSHPHVLQPVERRVVERRDGPQEVFIAWSLGNFISSQRHKEGQREWVDGAAVLSLMIERDTRGKARVAQASFTPTYVHWTPDHIRVMAVAAGLNPETRDIYELSDYDQSRLVALDSWAAFQLTRYLGSLPARQEASRWTVEFPAP